VVPVSVQNHEKGREQIRSEIVEEHDRYNRLILLYVVVCVLHLTWRSYVKDKVPNICI